MNRVRLMWAIMITSAITGMAQWALMGVVASNHAPETFPLLFWVGEWILWAVRAIVESICVGYMFMTVAEKRADKWTLTFFEGVILLMIAFTVGIMTMAVSSGQSVTMVLGGQFHPAWSFAIGAYVPLMMAGAGVAYRVQPVDQNRVIVDQSAIVEAEKLRGQVAELQQRNEALNDTHKYGAMFAVMSDINQARLVDEMKKIANGQTPQLEAAAKAALPAYTRSRAKVKKSA